MNEVNRYATATLPSIKGNKKPERRILYLELIDNLLIESAIKKKNKTVIIDAVPENKIVRSSAESKSILSKILRFEISVVNKEEMVGIM